MQTLRSAQSGAMTETRLVVGDHVAKSACVVAVDARVLAQAGKGVPRFLFETLREMAALPGVRPILFSNRPLHPANALPLETRIDKDWACVPGTIWMMARLNRLALEAGADIVWGPAHVLPPKHERLTTVLTVHDLVHRVMPESMGRWNRLVARLIADASIRRADRIIADSCSTKADISRMLAIDEGRVKVVYLGARASRQGPSVEMRDELQKREQGEPYLFVLGSIEPRKNIEGLLDVFDVLILRVPGLKMRLTGAHGWSATDTLRKISSNVDCEILGFISDSDIDRHMMGAAAFVMPSHYEGFGLPLIEAVGKAPIIAADIPVFRELGEFIDGIYYVNFSDPVRAADLIAEFLAKDPKPAQFAPGAEKIFLWQTVAERYAEVFLQERVL